MYRVRPLAASVLFLLAPFAAAAEDASFEDRVRAYILDNPDVILEALTLLSEREERAALLAKLETYPALFSDPPRLGEGDPDAPLRVVEFFDYRCAPCKAVHPQIEAFVATHPEVRVEMRHLPILSPGSERAARFALAADAAYGAEVYKSVHQKLWEMRGPLNTVGFQRISEELNLDFQHIESLMESESVTERIAYNRDVAIDLGVLGTPAFITENSMIFGSTDIDALAAAWLNQ
jgi:protein-disulfide isomerase